MSKYIIRRILLAIPILIGVSIITFGLTRLAPGDPLSNYMDPKVSPEQQQEMLEKMGFAGPIHVQYYNWVKNAVKGNLGYSARYRSTLVADMIKERMGPTLMLTGSSLILAFAIGVPIGVYSAVKQYSVQDYVITVLAFLGLSIPAFFLGLLSIYVFSVKLNLLPTAGMVTPGGEGGFVDILQHAILPVFVLTVLSLASNVRYTRSAMLEVVRQDYIRTARAKGLAEKVVVFRHALRNALIPVVTLLGLRIGTIFSGALLTETIFSWPGMGRLSYEAVLQRDYNVLMATTLLLSVMVVVGNLLADILYAAVDPRIRYD